MSPSPPSDAARVVIQSVLSFVFNTTVLAFLINIASGLF